MKKIFAFIVFVSMTASPLMAQEIRYGVKAGLNVSDWSGDASSTLTDLIGLTNVAEMKSGVAYHFGGYVEIPLSEKVFVEPGIQYSKKQVSINAALPNDLGNVLNFLNIRTNIDYTSQYIDIPLLLKVYPTKGFNIFAGPQVSLLLANKVNTEIGVLGFQTGVDIVDLSNQLRKTDFGVTTGLGYKFENGVNISASYDFGLSTLDKNDQFNAYNRVAKVSLGYTF